MVESTQNNLKEDLCEICQYILCIPCVTGLLACFAGCCSFADCCEGDGVIEGVIEGVTGG